MSDIISKIANRIYDLFVVNPYAIAIQQKNGAYLTKYVKYDASVLEAMLYSKGAAGCYQQGFRNALIKWICLDYDCKDKENPDLDGLYDYIKKNILQRLDEYSIRYLTEFSGRRGIHVWIIFNTRFEKRTGYQILKKILENLVLDREKYDLDEFPASDSAKNNKVGKQVKFPLSTHQKGEQSFFFKNEFQKNIPFSNDFFEKQYQILNAYQENSLEEICSKLDISLASDKVCIEKNKRYKILDNCEITVEQVVSTLSKTRVFKEIFLRIFNGKPHSNDWFVILGTIGFFDKNGDLIKAIFSQSAAYDEKITEKNVFKWKDKYFPATFGHLYRLYNLSIEENLDPGETGIDLLIRDGLISADEIVYDKKKELEFVSSVELTLKKEKKYICINDENIVISIWNKLKLYSSYDCKEIEKLYNKIKSGKKILYNPKGFVVFERNESPEKQRILISLNAYERILTTHLSLDLANSLNANDSEESFSYKVSFCSYYDIFDNWYTSWGNYIERIKTYIEMPFMKKWGVITLDIKNFYDSIDFNAVYDLCKSDLNDEQKNEFTFLIEYNERLMRKVNRSLSRRGVPQGPAYARIISELFLDKILSKRSYMHIPARDYRLYRYVDDIILFYKENIDGQLLYNEIKSLLLKNGLKLNTEKSRCYGPISLLSADDINVLLRKDKYNYLYQKSDMNMLLSENEKRKIFLSYDEKKFRIEDAAYIFSEKTETSYIEKYYKKHAKEMFESIYGRGSIFRKIYEYLFSNENVLKDFLKNRYYERIPINSLNFKNFISSMYLKIQSNSYYKDLFTWLCDNYLNTLSKNIESEEKTVIHSLLKWRNCDDL
ncbi:reverse transcriptase domain-containing protein [Fibrobacter sp. UWB3]|uniref:reverse transcriptase domain-containing protein n=1 Tax=Fibrobacter sp. UWB3 TaxID=1964357 RepID=UPI000B523DCF|nr:reverse transcriptase domain-containing protein [Fibrobacter sp. UWB3]OWV15685.1 hypothetical protein B7991_14495 [Fibrobacter sp. UWB3]